MKKLILLCSLLVSTTMFADKIDTIKDPVTGLKWASFFETKGMSFDYVESQTQDGGIFEDFHMATEAEVLQLLFNFDLAMNPDGSFDAKAGKKFINKFGDTQAPYNAPGAHWAFFSYIDTFDQPDGIPGLVGYGHVGWSKEFGSTAWPVQGNGLPLEADVAYQFTSPMLIKDKKAKPVKVPEPAAWVMMGLGMVFLLQPSRGSRAA